MKYVAYGVLILLTLVLQTAGVPGIVFFGFKPELMLMLTLLAGMIMPPAEAAVFGFFAGLAQDLIVGRFLTLHAGVFVLMALAEGFVARRFTARISLCVSAPCCWERPWEKCCTCWGQSPSAYPAHGPWGLGQAFWR